MPKGHSNGHVRGLFTTLIQSARRLDVRGTVQFGSLATLRTPGEDELAELYARLRKRTVFARHAAPERDTYAGKVRDFEGESLLWLTLPHGHDLLAEDVRASASRCERLVFLLAAYRLPRRQLHRLLGISPRSGTTDLLMDVTMQVVATQTHRTVAPRRLQVDASVMKLAERLGVNSVFDGVVRPRNETHRRVARALEWLEASRVEPSPEAALVKTAMGYEALLVFSERESIQATVGERLAFLLGRTAAQRLALAKSFRGFYRKRSAIVHGHGGTSARGPSLDLDQADRLLMLAATAVAWHGTTSPTLEELRVWCDNIKWSVDGAVPNVPFQRGEFERLLRQIDRRGTAA